MKPASPEWMPSPKISHSSDELTFEFENRLLPKTPWTKEKVNPEVLDKMMRMIVPFRFEVETIEGTWKLGQNKSDSARTNAAKQVRAYGIGHDPALLAAMMQSLPEAKDNNG